jgi:hypothetical protein
MHASVAGAHAREVSGIRCRAIAVIGVPPGLITKVYVKRSFAQYKCGRLKKIALAMLPANLTL